MTDDPNSLLGLVGSLYLPEQAEVQNVLLKDRSSYSKTKQWR
jgi:hypothetical protein